MSINILDRNYTKNDSKVSMDFQPTKHNEAVVVFTAEHGFVVLDKRNQLATPVEHLSIWGVPADKTLRYEFGYVCGQCNCRIVDVATGAAWDRYADSMEDVLKRVLSEREKSVMVQAQRQAEAQAEVSKPVIIEGNNPELVANALFGETRKVVESKTMTFKFSGPDGKTYTSETKTTIYED